MRFNELFSAVIALFAVSAAALPAADAHGDLVARDFVVSCVAVQQSVCES